MLNLTTQTNFLIVYPNVLRMGCCTFPFQDCQQRGVINVYLYRVSRPHSQPPWLLQCCAVNCCEINITTNVNILGGLSWGWYRIAPLPFSMYHKMRWYRIVGPTSTCAHYDWWLDVVKGRLLSTSPFPSDSFFHTFPHCLFILLLFRDSCILCTAGDIMSKEGGQVQKLVDLLFCGRSGVGTPETLVLLSLPVRRPSPSSMCIHQHLTPTLLGCGRGCGCYGAGRGRLLVQQLL